MEIFSYIMGSIHAHPVVWSLGAYYVTSGAIGALPMPDSDSHKFYRWFFQFSNTLGANLTRAMASKLPPSPQPPNIPNP